MESRVAPFGAPDPVPNLAMGVVLDIFATLADRPCA
jgi:hypothetical protein